MWKWLSFLIISIMLIAAGTHYKIELLNYSQAAWQQILSITTELKDNSPETAMQHAEKHLDPTYVCPMHGQIIKDEPGSCPICGMDLVQQQAPAKSTIEKKILYWVAPMDANYRRDKPGQSPMGMDLVPVYAEGDQTSDTITIHAAVQQNIGVKTTQVTRGLLQPKVNTVGYVDYNENSIAHIHLRTEGWVEKLLVKAEGDQVKKGQLIAEIYAPDLIRAQQDYIRVLQNDGSSLSQFAERNLMALGMSSRQIRQLRKSKKVTQTLKIYAPQNGIVQRLMIRDGMYVTPSDELLSLVDTSSIWIQANVFERQAKWISQGQSITASLNAYPQRQWQGKVDYIYPDLDAQTRSLKVRLRIDNQDRLLKQGMYAEVSIFVEPHQNALIIPKQAVIRDAQQQRVIVALGDGKFQARSITTGDEVEDQLIVLSGLQAGDAIVTSAHFLIDSEASLKASFARMQQDSQL